MEEDYSRLSGDIEEAAREKAIKGIRAWAGEHPLANPADADESPDPTEKEDLEWIADGFAFAPTGDLGEPTECLGFACPEKSEVCDVCRLSHDKKNVVWTPPLPRVSRHDAMSRLYLSAPPSRGARAKAESRAVRRMHL